MDGAGSKWSTKKSSPDATAPFNLCKLCKMLFPLVVGCRECLTFLLLNNKKGNERALFGSLPGGSTASHPHPWPHCARQAA